MTGKLKDESILLLDVAEQPTEFAQMKVGDSVTAYVDPKEVFVFVGQERKY